VENREKLMTFGEHLDELRQMLTRVVFVLVALMLVFFCFKEILFKIVLAPSHCDFVTYRAIERILGAFGSDFRFEPYTIELISTDLSAQFMIHIKTAIMLAAIVLCPYLLYELFRFVSPALYSGERKYAKPVLVAVYLLFVFGVLMNYFVLFPVSCRFLGTYQVNEAVTNTITLSSYITTFFNLTFVMSIVFQLPVIAFLLAKWGILEASMMKKYRRHALVLLMVVSAIITPPDVFTMILVTLPLYLLYELSISIVAKVRVART